MGRFWFFAFLMFSASRAPAKTLMVFAGGYNSCPAKQELLSMPHAKSVFQVLDTADELIESLRKRDADLEILWSCYSGVLRDGSLAHIAANGTMEFSFGMLPSAKPLTTVRFSAEDIDGAGPLAPYFYYLERLVAGAKPNAIYLVGQSYGAWSILHAGIRLANQDVAMEGMLLVDPISPNQCRAHVLFFGSAMLWPSPEGCQMAPRDFHGADMERLTKHTRWRTNLYQTRFKMLHSGPLGYPDWENREFKYRGWYLFGDTHAYMGTDSRVWTLARQRIERE